MESIPLILKTTPHNSALYTVQSKEKAGHYFYEYDRIYKPVMLKALFSLVDREGKVHLNDLARAFRAYYIQQSEIGQPLEQKSSLMAHPNEASDQAVKRLIITNPLERFLIKNFIAYFPEEDLLQVDPRLWQALFHYEVKDALASADEQIQYYLARQREKNKL